MSTVFLKAIGALLSTHDSPFRKVTFAYHSHSSSVPAFDGPHPCSPVPGQRVVWWLLCHRANLLGIERRQPSDGVRLSALHFPCLPWTMVPVLWVSLLACSFFPASLVVRRVATWYPPCDLKKVFSTYRYILYFYISKKLVISPPNICPSAFMWTMQIPFLTGQEQCRATDMHRHSWSIFPMMMHPCSCHDMCRMTFPMSNVLPLQEKSQHSTWIHGEMPLFCMTQIVKTTKSCHTKSFIQPLL